MTPEQEHEAWRKTVKALDSLCGMADTLMLDPLILALADAMSRSKEELARAEDRLSKPEGSDLHPREEGRLSRLLTRDDVLGNAYYAVKKEKGTDPEMKALTLEVLEEMHKEASEQFQLYRQEVGIPDPPKGKGRALRPV